MPSITGNHSSEIPPAVSAGSSIATRFSPAGVNGTNDGGGGYWHEQTNATIVAVMIVVRSLN